MMARSDQSRSPARFRVGWIFAFGSLVLVCGLGGYAFYCHQTERNTTKLLREAEQAVANAEWDAASTAYRQYLRRRPSDYEALAAYADVLTERVKRSPMVIGDAVRVLQRLVGMQPENAQAIAKLVEMYLALREFAVAQGLAERWVKLRPSDAAAVVALARIRQQLGHGEEAVVQLETALGQMPQEVILYPPLVQLLAHDLDRPGEAREWINRGLALGNDAFQIHLAAFSFHHGQNETEAAEQHLQRALDVAPDAIQVLIPAAAYHTSQGDLDTAEELLDRAEELSPPNLGLAEVRVAWASQKNEPAELAAAASALVELASANDLVLFAQAAELFLRAKRFDRADECIEKLTSAPTISAPLLGRLAALKGTRALFANRPYTAIPHLESARRQEPQNIQVARMLAAAFMTIGELDLAAESYRDVLSLAPDAVSAKLALARLEIQLGRPSAAYHYVRDLKSADPNQEYQAHVMRVRVDLLRVADAGAREAQVNALKAELDQLVQDPLVDAGSTTTLARCLILTGQHDRALDLLRRAMNNDDMALQTGSELGRLLIKDEAYDAAQEVADDLVDRFDGAMGGYELRLRILASTDNLTEALSMIDSAKTTKPVKGRLLAALARLQLDRDGEAGALEMLRKAAVLLPADAAVRQVLVRITSDLKEAQRVIEEMRAIEGDDGLHWKFERAAVLLRLDQTEDAAIRAAKLLETFLVERSHSPAARILLGDALSRVSRWQEAADSYRAAIAQNPALAKTSVAMQLVRVLTMLGRFVEADAVLNTLADARPDDPEILRLQTQQHYRNKNLVSAAAAAERLLELRQDDPSWAAVTANLQRRAGNPGKAEQIARTSLQDHPESTPALWSLAAALVTQRRKDEAENLIRQSAEDYNDAGHQILLARLLASFERKEEAAEVIQKAIDLAPNDAGVYATCADLWGLCGDRQQQVAFARKAVALAGEGLGKSLALAELLAGGSADAERAEAKAIVERCLAEDRDNPRALILDGQLAAMASPPQLNKAEASLTRALALEPRSPRSHRLLGSVLMRQARFQAARDTVTAGLSFSGDDPDLLLASAQIDTAMEDYERAIPTLRRLLQLRPRTPLALRLLAGAYQRIGHPDRAIGFLEQHTPKNQRTPGEMIILAKLFEQKKDAEQADTLFRQAQTLDERSAEVHREFLFFLARGKRFEEIHTLAKARWTQHPDDVVSLTLAGEILGSQSSDERLRANGMGWLETVARDHPEHAPDARYRSAVCYYRRHQLAEAESSFLEALHLAPQSVRVVNDLAWLYSEDLKQPGKALALIKTFLAGAGVENDHLLDTYGMALLRAGQFDAAKEQFAACLRIAGKSPTRTAARYHLGLVLTEIGRTVEAAIEMRRALELNDRRGGLSDQDIEEANRIVASASD